MVVFVLGPRCFLQVLKAAGVNPPLDHPLCEMANRCSHDHLTLHLVVLTHGPLPDYSSIYFFDMVRVSFILDITEGFN